MQIAELCFFVAEDPKIKSDKSSEMDRFVCDGNDAVQFRLSKCKVTSIYNYLDGLFCILHSTQRKGFGEFT